MMVQETSADLRNEKAVTKAQRVVRDLGGNARVGIPCPRPGCRGEVVYNGNYFCSNLDSSLFGDCLQVVGKPDADHCTWALSQGDDGQPIGRRDRAVWEEIKVWIRLHYPEYNKRDL